MKTLLIPVVTIAISAIAATACSPTHMSQARSSGAARVDQQTNTQQDLEKQAQVMVKEFNQDSKVFMQKLPPKSGAPGTDFVSAETVKNMDFVDFKNKKRTESTCWQVEGQAELECLSDLAAGELPPGKAGMGTNDLARDLIDDPDTMLETLEQMDSKGLTEGRLAETPWSDSYWPIYQGVLAARYADPKFPNQNGQKGYKDYKNFFNSYFGTTTNSSSVDNLSPAEKYDLLVGDDNWTLTKNAWSQGEQYFTQYGKVETWMGICHGWAPAAYMHKRPANKIEVLAADGVTKIPFYPSDIKALGSFLWANNRAQSRFIGGRCNDKDVETDEVGRIKSQDCFDNNPGSWHLSVVNQIGKSKRSMVMDATFDYEVWNHPILAYEYVYFNPETQETTQVLSEAKISLADLTADKFAKYRDELSTQLVGVAMRVYYVVETLPNHNVADSDQHDAIKEVIYVYDLELDSRNKIIGGEWYSNAHPDFLWTPPVGTKALSNVERYAKQVRDGVLEKYGRDIDPRLLEKPQDQWLYSYLISNWDAAEAMPELWTRLAQAASEQDQVLEKVVETLVTYSSTFPELVQ